MTKKWAYVTLPEAAARAGIGESTLRRMCSAGEVRDARRVGRAWLIPISTVDRLTPRTVGRPAKP